MEERERLSSAWTWFYRVLFPVVWIGGFGAGTVSLWVFSGPSPGPPPEFKYIFLAAWVGGTSMLLWFVRRLRDVWLQRQELVVMDFGSETRIPLSRVESVSESRFLNPKTITITAQPRLGFPEHVVFVAPAVFQLPFTDHPLVKRLQGLAEAARASR